MTNKENYMTLRERMKEGPVFGMAIFTSAACTVEALGNWGFDFTYLDLEHVPLDGYGNLERLIMAARASLCPIRERGMMRRRLYELPNSPRWAGVVPRPMCVPPALGVRGFHGLSISPGQCRNHDHTDG